MADSSRTAAARRRAIIRALGLLATATLLLVFILALIAVSKVPMRGAEYFGALANKIKGNPGATAFISLTAAVALWLSIGLLAAIQEWSASRGSRT